MWKGATKTLMSISGKLMVSMGHGHLHSQLEEIELVPHALKFNGMLGSLFFESKIFINQSLLSSLVFFLQMEELSFLGISQARVLLL